MYVVMPTVAVLMARVFDLPERTELALVILAICAGAPLLSKKLIKFGGDPSYVFSLIVNTSLLAIVTVPASLHLLAGAISLDMDVDRGPLAGRVSGTYEDVSMSFINFYLNWKLNLEKVVSTFTP